ncbi:glycosyltransferase [Jannaschia sp. Os4]|uniref:glycosyltransferase family 2 protein n=1 Tax=Jannaschia sp. Os4 TaxID=2807617 RepID=UPI00193AA2F2|nr:glycosyltransferase family 2 protein [Jannaschia sp. Os4]MBM2575895.1 glycosyltransferase [Jannaschia sp. Os4]
MTLLGYLALAALVLASIYVSTTFVNLVLFRAPRAVAEGMPEVSVLIPARDEADNIRAALDGALAQWGVEVEVVVLDDGSTDGTDGIVAEYAARDPRVRLVRGADLPAGWNGKQHACHQLSQAASHPVLLFVDADVRLAPDAAARMRGYMQARGLDLVSGFPRQVTGSLAERVAIPQILMLLLGYLPFAFARLSNSPGFAAGCGQLMMVTAGAYAAAGGHAAFRDRMHDGLNLPRNVRLSGGRTDILDATPLAVTRMYDNWPDIVSGFSKNATEGMAKPVALPVWTVLLAGGHLLPFLTLALGLLFGAEDAVTFSASALGLVLAARALLAWRVCQGWRAVLLHPAGVVVTLWIQWRALAAARRGETATWRGRSYEVN